MEFDEAIAAHSAWKSKLKVYFLKPDKSLNVTTIAMDDQCALGKWLYAEGAKYASYPEFKELKAQHTSFHRAAADLVKRADAGEKVSEEAALGASSPFSHLSARVVQLILAMKQKVH